MRDWIGYRWLSEEFGICPVQDYPCSSCIGPSRRSDTRDGIRLETYPEQYRPDSSFAGHLGFALRREGVHLEFLSRLFHAVPASKLSEWVNSEPSGQYARRAGFLYEWLTGQLLDFPGVQVGNYVEALPSDQYLTSVTSVNNPRWRVRDNMPGNRSWCPTVQLTEVVQLIKDYDVIRQWGDIESEFGTDLLQRSAVWLTIRESRASFLIEREEGQTDRVRRFAGVLERLSGEFDDVFHQDALLEIQHGILGEKAFRYGIRRSPVFVGSSSLAETLVDYVAPDWELIPAMLEGLALCASRTSGRSSVIRAAMLSFGFVFLHPFADGNGRFSRFLINDTLHRDRVLPRGLVLPVSATITRSVQNRAAYDAVLEAYSRPLMRAYGDSVIFGKKVQYDDDVTSDIAFGDHDLARPVWQYPDLTRQVEYLGHVIQETFEVELRREAKYLVDLYETRAKIKEIVEAPDPEIDRIIRSIRETGVVSNKLLKEFPLLEDTKIAEEIVLAVMDSDSDTLSD